MNLTWRKPGFVRVLNKYIQGHLVINYEEDDVAESILMHYEMGVGSLLMAEIYTRVKISQTITGLLAQQPCNNTVNMIEQDWQNNSIVQYEQHC